MRWGKHVGLKLLILNPSHHLMVQTTNSKGDKMSKQFKGTPGKFTSQVFGSRSGDVFVEVLDNDGCSIASCGQGEIARHNARLFAAAPELLEALQDIIIFLAPQNRAREVIENAVKAVNKALGE